MTVTGAIFCGGKSSRMGRDKASLELSGRPMAVSYTHLTLPTKA